MTEERVKDIDPFDSIVQQVKERQRKRMTEEVVRNQNQTIHEGDIN